MLPEPKRKRATKPRVVNGAAGGVAGGGSRWVKHVGVAGGASRYRRGASQDWNLVKVECHGQQTLAMVSMRACRSRERLSASVTRALSFSTPPASSSSRACNLSGDCTPLIDVSIWSRA